MSVSTVLEPVDLRLPEPYALVAARHGTMLVNRNDLYMGQAYLAYGECCEVETQFLLSLLRVPGAVIEVGANMGVHTVPMARALAGEGRRMMALEPQPVIFQQLCANLALNGLMNVTALPYACGSTPSRVRIEIADYLKPGNFGAAAVGAVGGSNESASRPIEEVPSLPLDRLVPERVAVGLIKVDVEGSELCVLQGATEILERCRPVLYVENDRLDRSPALIRWLMARDYRLWWHLPPLYNAGNLRGVAENLYPGVCSYNMLCLPRESAMRVEGEQEIRHADEHPAPSGTAGR